MAEKLTLEIEFDETGAVKGIKNIDKTLDSSTKKTEQASKKQTSLLGRVGSAWKAIGAIAGTVVVGALGAMAKRAIDASIQFEQTRIAFNTFVGSAEKGGELLKQLQDFSIITPFTIDQVNSAAKSLLAFGVEAEKIQPTLKILGDVSAGTGKDLSEMAVIFGQIRSTGKLMGQDLLQLINAGFNPLQEISKKTGESVGDLKAQMEKGAISFQMVEDAFKSATSEGGTFFNLMEKQSQSLGGRISTLQGNISLFARDIGDKLAPAVGKFVDFMNTRLTQESDLKTLTQELITLEAQRKAGIDKLTSSTDELNKKEKERTERDIQSAINKQRATITRLAEAYKEATVASDEYSSSEIDKLKGLEQNYKRLRERGENLLTELVRLQDEFQRTGSIQSDYDKSVQGTTANTVLFRSDTEETSTVLQNLRRLLGNASLDYIDLDKAIRLTENAIGKYDEKVESATSKTDKLTDEIEGAVDTTADLVMANSKLDIRLKQLEKTNPGFVRAVRERIKELQDEKKATDELSKTPPTPPPPTGRGGKNQADALKELLAVRDQLLNKATTERQLLEQQLALINGVMSKTKELGMLTEEQEKKLLRLHGEITQQLADLDKKQTKEAKDDSKELTDARIADLQRFLDASRQVFSEIGTIADTITERQLSNIQRRQQAEMDALQASFDANTIYNDRLNEISEERTRMDIDNKNKELDEAIRAGNSELARKLELDIEEARLQKREAERTKEFEEQKAELERDQAIESARIERKSAVFKRIASIFEIIVNTAVGISKAVSQSPMTGGLPGSALATASGIAQTAIVASEPLPEIPVFQMGGTVPGRERSGDRSLVRANRGETIINTRQGQNLFDSLTMAGLLSDRGSGVTNNTDNSTRNNQRITNIYGNVTMANSQDFNDQKNRQLAIGGDFS